MKPREQPKQYRQSEAFFEQLKHSRDENKSITLALKIALARSFSLSSRETVPSALERHSTRRPPLGHPVGRARAARRRYWQAFVRASATALHLATWGSLHELNRQAGRQRVSSGQQLEGAVRAFVHSRPATDRRANPQVAPQHTHTHTHTLELLFTHNEQRNDKLI